MKAKMCRIAKNKHVVCIAKCGAAFAVGVGVGLYIAARASAPKTQVKA